MPNTGTILVIDDSLFIRSALTEALTTRGFQVLTAENGKEGLSVLQRTAPDAILMDVVMPIMDGWETCRQIRAAANLQAVPIIIMTHKNTSSDLLRAFEAGANDFLEKPIEADVVVEAIRNAMARASRRAVERR